MIRLTHIMSLVHKVIFTLNNTGAWPNGCLIVPYYGR
jgi:hypothetical protein